MSATMFGSRFVVWCFHDLWLKGDGVRLLVMVQNQPDKA